MKPPLVSICIPNRNTRDYLEERRRSIDGQTFQDFEVIVVDDDSTDGARQYLDAWAAEDERVNVYSGPSKGLYPGWNDALRRARGRYIYIATSDDSMLPECLEQMVSSLESHPQCGACHCELIITGVDGKALADESWSPWKFMYSEFSGKQVIRHAPHDGFMHLAVGSFYISVTQLLVRASVYKDIGYFREDFGPKADFEWGMRLGLTQNVFYLPQALATWRRHETQATGNTETAETRQQQLEMAVAAIHTVQRLQPNWLTFPSKRMLRYYRLQEFWFTWKSQQGVTRQIFWLIKRMKHNPGEVFLYGITRILNQAKPFHVWQHVMDLKRQIQQVGIEPPTAIEPQFSCY